MSDLEQLAAHCRELGELIQAEDTRLLAYLAGVAHMLDTTEQPNEFERQLVEETVGRCAEIAGYRVAFLAAGAREIADSMTNAGEETNQTVWAPFLAAQVSRAEELLSTARVAAAAMALSDAVRQRLEAGQG